MQILDWFFLSLILLWSISFLINVIYFFKKESEPLDGIFFNKSKSFEEAFDDLALLEKQLGRKLEKVKKKIRFYEENARLTKRKYRYYSEKIEPYFTQLYVGEKLNWRNCWKHLDFPFRLHYILIVSVLVIICLFMGLIGIISIIGTLDLRTFFATVFLLVVFLLFSRFIIKFNYLIFFILVDGLLILLKRNRKRLYRNIVIIEELTKKWKSRGQAAMVIGGAGAYVSSGSGGGFGGFGGGSFGGGGAGGSW